MENRHGGHDDDDDDDDDTSIEYIDDDDDDDDDNVEDDDVYESRDDIEYDDDLHHFVATRPFIDSDNNSNNNDDNNINSNNNNINNNDNNNNNNNNSNNNDNNNNNNINNNNNNSNNNNINNNNNDNNMTISAMRRRRRMNSHNASRRSSRIRNNNNNNSRRINLTTTTATTNTTIATSNTTTYIHNSTTANSTTATNTTSAITTATSTADTTATTTTATADTTATTTAATTTAADTTNITNSNNQSQNDFVVRKVGVSLTKERKGDNDVSCKISLLDTSMESFESCPICLEAWTNSGMHRLCCLKCGHLFGQSCIEKWLKESCGNRACPTCNTKASRKDIRIIFAKKLVALDTCERDRLVTEVETERRQNDQLQLELAKNSLQLKMVLAECQQFRETSEKLRNSIQHQQQQANSTTNDTTTTTSYNNNLLVFETDVKFASHQQCRVMAHDESSMTLCVSQNSHVPLFAEYGVKKICGEVLCPGEFIPIHMKLIRDLSFHPYNADSLLLSASIDKTLKLTNLNSKQVVQIFNTTSPVWSCCWSGDNTHDFYAGLLNNNILHFDIRMTSGSVSQLPALPLSKSVLSMHYLPKTVGALYRPGGLLVGHLDSCSFYQNQYNSENIYKPHPLHLQGLLTSLSLDPPTNHLLASFRPSSSYPVSKHSVSTPYSTLYLQSGVSESSEASQRRSSCVSYQYHDYL